MMESYLENYQTRNFFEHSYVTGRSYLVRLELYFGGELSFWNAHFWDPRRGEVRSYVDPLLSN